MSSERVYQESQQIACLAREDPGYPENMRLAPETPDVVYVRGSINPDDRVAVAVVGQVNVRITGGSVSTSGDAGVVFGEQASGSASGLVCGDKPVVLGEQTSVQLVDSPSCEVTRG